MMGSTAGATLAFLCSDGSVSAARMVARARTRKQLGAATFAQ